MNVDWRNRYDAMLTAGRIAGKIALSYFDTGIAVEQKSDQSPVTIADRETEAYLRKHLLEAFPKDGLLGEEYGDHPGTSGYRWIIDPIDGTRSFIRNIPIWGTLIGLEYRDVPIGGLCYIPVWDQMYHAMQGNGAYRDQRKISVSTVPSLNKALVSYSSFGFFKVANKEQNFLDFLNKSERSRSYSDFYGFMMVAQGSVDVMVEYGVHIWDVAGLKVIVEEAGGTFSDWSGQPNIDRPDVLATNGLLHTESLEILQK